MIKIWGHANSSNVQKVLWASAELDVAYERVDLGGPFGGLADESYTRLNPNSLVPTIEDGDFVLWESNSIVRYLADKYGGGRLVPGSPEARGDAWRWMDWQATTLAPALQPVFFGLVRTKPEERDQAKIDAGIRASNAAFAIIERYLEGRDYLAGDEMTIADIPFGPFVHRWRTLDFEKPDLPRVAAWYGRLGDRPAYREHVKVALR